jgi:pyruvate formate lyase activating enzyme
MGVLVEVTNLLIPTLNDADEDITKLCRWIKSEMGADTPLHFSRFFPHYRMRNLPPTPAETLDKARAIARAEGLHHVYIGNLLSRDGENTLCPSCGQLLIRRKRYRILENNMHDGACPKCGAPVHGIWS